MLVQCRANDIRSAESDSCFYNTLKESFGFDTNILNLTVGAIYVVYALEVKSGRLRYYISDDVYHATRYPGPYDAYFLEAVDRRVSRFWEVAFRDSNLIVSFSQWAQDQHFYEKLVEGDEDARRIFEAQKGLMDTEFLRPDTRDVAIQLDAGTWLCPKCDHVWQAVQASPMVKCPDCASLLKAPEN